MRVLLTGATGFLGTAVADEFRRRGIGVVPTGKRSAPAGSHEYISADLAGDLREFDGLENISAIVHTAGLAHQFGGASEKDFWRANVQGTANISNLARRLKVRDFVLISSVAVYGQADLENLEFEEDAVCKPSGAYAASKYEAERATFEILAGGGINLKILRPSTIVGEGDPGNLSRLIRAIDRRKFFWLGKGENLKSLVYKQDVARACAAVLQNDTGGEEPFEIYNVTAEPRKMHEIVEEIEKALGKKVPKLYMPSGAARFGLRWGAKTGAKKIVKLRETIEKWLSDDVFSGEKIKAKLKFFPETEALEAVRREVLDYKKSC